jgi:hypothetical protein
LTFSHSRKLERVRLLGVERFRLYVDALTEAHAEMTWLEDRVLHDGLRQRRYAPGTT